MMSANLLPMLGVTPVVGRGFTAAEDKPGGEPVAMLSDYLWQARFGGRPERARASASSSTARPYSIVGVLPASFRLFQKADVFLPIGAFIAAQPADRGWHPGIQPIAPAEGRRRRSIRRGREIAGIAARLEKAYPETNTKMTMLGDARAGRDGPGRPDGAARAAGGGRRACCSSPASTSPACCSRAA